MATSGVRSSKGRSEKSPYSLVVFNNVPATYPTETDVACHYTITPELTPSRSDWVGLYRVGWGSITEYVYYEWSPVFVDQPLGSELQNQIMFPARQLPKEDGEFYQFCYVSGGGQVRGASTPFQFKLPASGDFVEVPNDDDDHSLVFIESKAKTLESDALNTRNLNENLIQENDEFLKQLIEKGMYIENLQLQIGSLTSERDTLTKKVTELEEEKKLFKVMLHDYMDKEDRMKGQLDERQRELVEQAMTLRSLQEQLVSATENLDNQILINRTGQEYIGELNKTLDEKDKRLADADLCKKQMVEELEALKLVYSKKCDEHEDRQYDIDTLNKRLDGIEKDYDHKSKIAIILQEQLDAKNDECKDKTSKTSMLQEELNCIKNRLAIKNEECEEKATSVFTFQEDIGVLRKHLQEKDKICADNNRMISNLKEEIGSLQKQLEEKENECEHKTKVACTFQEVKTKCEDDTKKINNLQKENESILKQLEEKENDCECYIRTIGKMKEEICSLRGNIDGKVMEYEEKTMVISILQEEIGSVRKQLEENNRKYENNTRRVTDLLQEIGTLQRQTDEMVKECENKTRVISVLQEEKGKQFEEHTRTISNMQDEMISLQKQLDGKDEKCKNDTRLINNLKEEIIYLQTQTDGKQKECEDKTSSVIMLQQNVELLRQQLEEKDKDYGVNITTIHNMQEEIGSLQKQIDIKEKEFEDKTTVVSTLHKEMESLRKELDEKEKICVDKIRCINNLHEEKESLLEHLDRKVEECEDKTRAVRMLQEETEFTRKQLEEKDKKCEGNTRTITNLQDEMQSLLKQLKEEKDNAKTINKLQDEVGLLEKRLDNKEKECEHSIREMGMLQEQVQRLTGQLQINQGCIGDLTDEVKDLVDKLSEAECYKRLLQEKIDTLKMAHTKNSDSFELTSFHEVLVKNLAVVEDVDKIDEYERDLEDLDLKLKIGVEDYKTKYKKYRNLQRNVEEIQGRLNKCEPTQPVRDSSDGVIEEEKASHEMAAQSEQHNNNDFKGRPASTGAYLKFQIMHKTDLDICAAEEFDRDNRALFSPDTARAEIESSGTREPEAAEDIVADNEKVQFEKLADMRLRYEQALQKHANPRPQQRHNLPPSSKELLPKPQPEFEETGRQDQTSAGPTSPPPAEHTRELVKLFNYIQISAEHVVQERKPIRKITPPPEANIATCDMKHTGKMIDRPAVASCDQSCQEETYSLPPANITKNLVSKFEGREEQK